MKNDNIDKNEKKNMTEKLRNVLRSTSDSGLAFFVLKVKIIHAINGN